MEAVKPRKKHKKKNKNAATESIKTEEDAKNIQGLTNVLLFLIFLVLEAVLVCNLDGIN